ncbi:MAG: hypothetical protein ACLSH9_08485 [Mediterraneibacter gnavus]|uniref:hypothetical protein n=1 Tax=Mediterraneibacter gnavus TaxID=33038 RepID=UPI00366E3DAE
MSIGLYIVLAPLYLKSVRKLQEKRFVFVKILAIIIPENGAKVSKIKCFQFAQQTLVQCANSVVKSEKHPEIRNRYLRLRKRRGHKKAIIAIARMLLTALYNMLKNKEPYNAELYRKSDVLPVNREITIEQAILMAQFQGYKIKSAAE